VVNQVVLVGRLVYDPELRKLESGRKVTTITLALQRSFKSAESGTYETDFIRCTLWSGIAENTVAHCRKGSTVGVKARLAQRFYKLEEDRTFTYPEVVAEKISFISPKHREDTSSDA